MGGEPKKVAMLRDKKKVGLDTKGEGKYLRVLVVCLCPHLICICEGINWCFCDAS